MWQSVWQFINTNAPGIGVLLVAGALIYAGVQAGQIRKQLQLGSITASSLHFKEINQMILEHEGIADLFGASSREARGDYAAAVEIGMHETRFLLHRAKLLDDQMWRVDQLTMIRNFGGHDLMLSGWQKFGKEY